MKRQPDGGAADLGVKQAAAGDGGAETAVDSEASATSGAPPIGAILGGIACAVLICSVAAGAVMWRRQVRRDEGALPALPPLRAGVGDGGAARDNPTFAFPAGAAEPEAEYDVVQRGVGSAADYSSLNDTTRTETYTAAPAAAVGAPATYAEIGSAKPPAPATYAVIGSAQPAPPAAVITPPVYLVPSPLQPGIYAGLAADGGQANSTALDTEA